MVEISPYLLGSHILKKLKDGKAVFITPSDLKGFDLSEDPTVVPTTGASYGKFSSIRFVEENLVTDSMINVVGKIMVSEVLVQRPTLEPVALTVGESLKNRLTDAARKIGESLSELFGSRANHDPFKRTDFKDLSLVDQLEVALASMGRSYNYFILLDEKNLTRNSTRPSPFGKKKFDHPKKVIRK